MFGFWKHLTGENGIRRGHNWTTKGFKIYVCSGAVEQQVGIKLLALAEFWKTVIGAIISAFSTPTLTIHTD